MIRQKETTLRMAQGGSLCRNEIYYKYRIRSRRSMKKMSTFTLGYIISRLFRKLLIYKEKKEGTLSHSQGVTRGVKLRQLSLGLFQWKGYSVFQESG